MVYFISHFCVGIWVDLFAILEWKITYLTNGIFHIIWFRSELLIITTTCMYAYTPVFIFLFIICIWYYITLILYTMLLSCFVRDDEIKVFNQSIKSNSCKSKSKNKFSGEKRVTVYSKSVINYMYFSVQYHIFVSILFIMQGSLLLININPSMGESPHAQWYIVCNYSSIPKLQRLHRWSLGMDK